MTILVLGGTGTVGRSVVRGLLDTGAAVRVLTRSVNHFDRIPSPATGVLGDLTDPTTLNGTFEGIDRLFLLNAVSPTELQQGLVALQEARRCGVERVVYLSVHHAERGPHVPHFASKGAMERALDASGLDVTILRANNFFQNDGWSKDALLAYGIYPQPIGDVGLSRIDAGDVAHAAVNALTQDSHVGRTYALVGPDVLTGAACAAVYADALGDASIQYAGNDLDAWSAQAARMLPSWMVYDLRLMYALFQAEGLVATDADHEQTRNLLGRAPRRFADFAAALTAE